MSSGAQLNRWGTSGGVSLLTFNSAATAVADPKAGYGTLGVNDSGAYVTPIGLKTWTFMVIQTGGTPPTGFELTLLGTIDPLVYKAYEANGGIDGFLTVTSTAGGPNFGVVYTIPATSWGIIPGPSEQSGTGTSVNPITASGVFFQANIALVAVRAVLTGVTGIAGSGTVLGFAIP